MSNDVYKKLLAIQLELKAPKGQMNKFGGYKYRSCEDILEAVKPLADKHGICFILTDYVSAIEGKSYVIGEAKAIDVTTGNTATASAWAREAMDAKGMAPAQMTGSSSSYARKYALGGLLLLDDTKDDDATNTHDKPEYKPVRSEPPTLSTPKDAKSFGLLAPGVQQTDKGMKTEVVIKEVVRDTGIDLFVITDANGVKYYTDVEATAYIAKTMKGKKVSINFNVDSDLHNFVSSIA